MWFKWDDTRKVWQISTDNVNFNDTVENFPLEAEFGKWIQHIGIAAPAASPASKGRIYFDSGDNKYKVSENTGAYRNLVSPLTTKGDVHSYSTVDARLGVGADNELLSALASEATGLKWKKFPSCRVYHNANQAISASTDTVLAFNSERFDTDALHDVSTNNSRITFPLAGKYIVGCIVTWSSTGTFHDVFSLIRLNGSTVIAKASGINDVTIPGTILVETIYDFAANDYIEVVVRQSSAGSRNVEAIGNSSPEFWAHRLS